MTTQQSRTKRTVYVVYKIYDVEGELIYVGFTNSVARRFADHASKKDWWGEVDRVDLERFPDRQAAQTREGNLIVENRPRYNLAINTGYADSRPEVIEAVQVAVARSRAARAEVVAARKNLQATLSKARMDHSMSRIARELGVSKQRIHQLTQDV